MPLTVDSLRRGPLSWLRLLAAALLALQVGIACSPLFEHPSALRAYSHAHDQQRRHRAAHDESTCAVCSARQQVAEAAPRGEAVRVSAREGARTILAPASALAVAPRGVHPSRAPPATA